MDRDLREKDLSVRLFQPHAVTLWDGLGDMIAVSRTASDRHCGGDLQGMAAQPLPASDLTQPEAVDGPAEPFEAAAAEASGQASATENQAAPTPEAAAPEPETQEVPSLGPPFPAHKDLHLP